MLKLSIVTLGVENVAAATEFYEKLGLRRSEAASNEHISFFQLGAGVLALFGREALRDDSHALALWTGQGGFTLAQCLPSEADVDQTLSLAKEAGATILKAGGKTFWGGYSGHFADRDGHIWEISHNPFFPLTEDGSVTLP